MLLSRRDFLKLSGLAFGAALLPPLPLDEAPRRATLLGRTIYLNYIYDRPSFNGRQVGLIPSESVFSIYNTVQSADSYYNRTWYEMQRGYVHSASVQPVRWQLQTPLTAVPPDGFLGEVTVPFTLAKAGPGINYNTAYRFYYSTTHWITDVVTDEDDGLTWYRAFDDRFHEYNWVRADHIRRVSTGELAPISPGVADKRIEVDLDTQVFRCLENGQVVQETLCSTGPYLRTENGRRLFGTPTGDWFINRKRPTRHMAGDDLAADDFFDLPGVPWVSYFHWWGVSIHGTYWHNDYGRPRSHGCVNLPSDVAKWVYRWTLPVGDVTEHETNGDGTPVIVIVA
jgi:hypothetical protein